MENTKPSSASPQKKVVDRSMPPPPLPKKRANVFDDLRPSSKRQVHFASQPEDRRRDRRFQPTELGHHNLPVDQSDGYDVFAESSGAALVHGPRAVTWNASTKRPFTFDAHTPLTVEPFGTSFTSDNSELTKARSPQSVLWNTASKKPFSFHASTPLSIEQLNTSFYTPSRTMDGEPRRGNIECLLTKESVENLSNPLNSESFKRTTQSARFNKHDEAPFTSPSRKGTELSDKVSTQSPYSKKLIVTLFDSPTKTDNKASTEVSIRSPYSKRFRGTRSNSLSQANTKSSREKSVQSLFSKKTQATGASCSSNREGISMMQPSFDASTPLSTEQFWTAIYAPNPATGQFSSPATTQNPSSSQPSTQRTPPPSTPERDHLQNVSSPGSLHSNDSTIPNSPPILPEFLTVTAVPGSLRSGSDESNADKSRKDYQLQWPSSDSTQFPPSPDTPPRAPEAVMAEAAARRGLYATAITALESPVSAVGTSNASQGIAQYSPPYKRYSSTLSAQFSGIQGARVDSMSRPGPANLNPSPFSPEINMTRPTETYMDLRNSDEIPSGGRFYLGHKGFKHVSGVYKWMSEVAPKDNENEDNDDEAHETMNEN